MQKKLLKNLLPKVMILATCLVSCASASVPTWTLRSDGRIRASQRNENFSAEELIAKIQFSEGKDYAVVVTPSGVKELNDKISLLEAKLRECREGLQ